ncbi:hypothetical protein AB0C28_07625 [Nonomuraea sp. NPDC048892]|uniref:hypothetical protein n=1 Tax=Nonomuraea sp. NPDC048892 TaxID=3154624 RepID=UPI00340C381E
MARDGSAPASGVEAAQDAGDHRRVGARSRRASRTTCRAADNISPCTRRTSLIRRARCSYASRRSSSAISGLIRRPRSIMRRVSSSTTSSGRSSASSICRSRRLAALAASTASRFSSSRSAAVSPFTPSLVTSHGKVSPCTISVTRMTAKEMNTMTARSGNGPPPSVSTSTATTADSTNSVSAPGHEKVPVTAAAMATW